MKAIISPKYGSPDILQLQEVAKPTPQDDEILIKIHAASINARDWRMMRANPCFIRLVPGGFLQPKNKILGDDVAGRVEMTGNKVKEFKPGDEIFGYLPSATGRGTFAEYVCATENAIALKPVNLTFEQAAAVPVAAMTALQGLRNKGNIQPGQKVLINGASGGSMFQLIQAASNRNRISKTGNQKISIASLVQSHKDLIFMKELLESGRVIPVIDRCYPLTKRTFIYNCQFSAS